MASSKNPIELTKSMLGNEFFETISKVGGGSNSDISREVEKSTNQLNLALSQIIIGRLPIIQKMITFLNKLEDKMFSEDTFKMCEMKLFDAEGKQIEVFTGDGKKLESLYDIRMLSAFYEKVNKDFLMVLDFIRKYTSKLPLESGNEMSEREKDIMRVLSNLSDEELSEISRIVYERQSKKG